jgi:hypothetical protein
MTVRGLILLTTALALLAAAPAHADLPAAVRVLSCEPWQPGDGGSVSYEARMKAFDGTERMALRVRLLERSGDGDYHRVDADELDVWRKSRPGATAFVWEQKVRGLRQGAVYRAVVDYRWLDANGDEIAGAHDRSAPCGQGDALPNLRIASIDVRRGDVDGTAVYRVKIANRGESTARHVGVLLRVDGEVVDEVEKIDVLQPDETKTVTFSGPVCRDHMRAVVDPKRLIAESDEQDNARALACL